MKRIILTSILVLTALTYATNTDHQIVIEPLVEEVITPKTYKMIFAGDIMLDRGVRKMIKDYGEDYGFPFLNIKDDLEADIVFANLESMISDQGENIGSIYSFRAEPKAINGLKYAGFNVVSLANNHTFDYDRPAFEDTMQRLTDAGIIYAGAGFNQQEAHSVKIIELDDFKVGFLAYTEFLYPYTFANENRSGVTTLNRENLERDIVKAKDEVDFLIVTFHCGDEYQEKPNQNQITWSESAIDYGADMVIGHHPHVTQPIKKYNDKYIAYSLGNFVFDQYFSEETMSGFLFEIEIQEGKITSAKKKHYKLNEYYQPEVYQEEVIG
jgi:poly-gamma-glutamate synthesis protein (capsule biosynthesis protein)